MRTHLQIIEAAGGRSGLATKLGVAEERVRFWQRRGGIPVEFWEQLEANGIASLQELVRGAASRRRDEGAPVRARGAA